MIFRELNDGRCIPALGFGTWELEGDVCSDAVETALQIGYRHIDTAVRYGNEASVGRGVARSGLPRAEVFVTTKVWHDSLHYDALLRSIEQSLDRLGMTYVDLFLVHWPNPAVPLADTMSALAEVRKRGWARSIGVSNFTIGLLREAFDRLKMPLVANQVEMHPFLDQRRLYGEMRARGMVAEAYQPLAGGKAMADPVIGEIARRYNRTPAQVTLRWLLDREGVVAIPRSRKRENIASNFDVFSFALDPGDRARIDGLQGNGRFLSPAFSPQWD